VQQTVNGTLLASVSCQSSTFCVAVGDVAVVWNGSGFSTQFEPATAFLDGVSCAAATSGSCEAVGYIEAASQTLPYAVAYENGQWASGGPLPVEPSATRRAFLTGVYCVTAQSCQAVGNYSTSAGTGEIWGAGLSGSTWSLSSLPPSGVGASFGVGGAVTCPQECWAVGSYASSNGEQGFADDQSGATWGFASLPAPGGVASFLNAVSCAQINYCLAVGTTSNPKGTVAFAERYTYTIPSGGSGGRKCVSLNCLPLPPGTPHRFVLSGLGTEGHGATVIAVLLTPRTLVLLVEEVRHHRRVIVGLVPLGSYHVGTSRIHWDLRVAHHLLSPGTYEVSLSSISVDVLSPATPPGAFTLTVKADGQVRVGRSVRQGGLR
jgi:hypothetical protein